MPRLHRTPMVRQRPKKSSRKHTPMPAGTLQPKGQSFFGTLSILVGMLVLFALAVEGLLKLQASQGSPGLIYEAKPYLLPAEFFGPLVGLVLAILSFVFSSKRQRNAVLGVLLNLALLTGWVALRLFLK